MIGRDPRRRLQRRESKTSGSENLGNKIRQLCIQLHRWRRFETLMTNFIFIIVSAKSVSHAAFDFFLLSSSSPPLPPIVPNSDTIQIVEILSIIFFWLSCTVGKDFWIVPLDVPKIYFDILLSRWLTLQPKTIFVFSWVNLLSLINQLANNKGRWSNCASMDLREINVTSTLENYSINYFVVTGQLSVMQFSHFLTSNLIAQLAQ